MGNAIDGYNININIRVGGKNEGIYRRTLDEFIKIVHSLLGVHTPELEEPIKKKVEVEEREIIYDIALSFAGEQRVFVREVADLLRGQGILVFFDEYNQAKMWGEDLSQYLWRVYYKESNYCGMFISEDYVRKAWPTWEKRAAIAREVKTLGGYILPVRFDDSEVPELPAAVVYLPANIKWPKRGAGLDPQGIVDMYIKKVSP
jgi:hypothetical protein